MANIFQMLAKLASSNTGENVELKGDHSGALLVSHSMPKYSDLTRRGNGWTIKTATAFAPDAAEPAVTARLELFNNSSSAQPLVMVIKDLFAFQLLATAATQTYAIWAMVTTQKVAPTNTALVMASLSGKTSITTVGGGPILSAIDTTVIANGWRPYGAVQAWGTAAATPGNAWSADVDGGLIVPPGCSFCMTIAGSLATASTFRCGVTFYLEPMKLATV